MADLSALKQNIKRCCNFFWLYEGVNPAVEQQKIEIIGLQPFYNTVHRFQNVLFRRVIAALADAAFGLDQNILAVQEGSEANASATVSSCTAVKYPA